MQIDLHTTLEKVDLQVSRSSAEIKKKWRKENFRLPKESKIFLAAMAQNSKIPMEDIVNQALLFTYRTYIQIGITQKNKMVQLEMF